MYISLLIKPNHFLSKPKRIVIFRDWIPMLVFRPVKK